MIKEKMEEKADLLKELLTPTEIEMFAKDKTIRSNPIRYICRKAGLEYNVRNEIIANEIIDGWK